MDENKLLDKIETIIRLLGIIAISGKNRELALNDLAVSGLPHKEIASLLGITPLNVRVQLSRTRKRKSKTKKKI